MGLGLTLETESWNRLVWDFHKLQDCQEFCINSRISLGFETVSEVKDQFQGQFELGSIPRMA